MFSCWICPLLPLLTNTRTPQTGAVVAGTMFLHREEIFPMKMKREEILLLTPGGARGRWLLWRLRHHRSFSKGL